MSRNRALILTTISAAILANCASALPVRGRSADGSEFFTGTSTGTIESGGVISIRSNLGRSCRGEFYYINPRAGAGTLSCSDGAIGSFQFVGAGLRGTGTAVIGGKSYTFSFG